MGMDIRFEWESAGEEKFLAYNQIMEIEKLLKSQKEQILAIAHKNGAYDVRVFGSVARGEARPDSDIDFLVKLEAGRSLLDLARLLRELQTLLGLSVDVVTEAGLRARIRPRVLKEARPL
jgi:predicted nucleotidyltransferase